AASAARSLATHQFIPAYAGAIIAITVFGWGLGGCSISLSALATAKSSAASRRGKKARRCGRARVFFLALFAPGVGAALPTHDALNHHGRDAREHGLGHRG